MSNNKIEFESAKLPCQQVTIYNDRAEVKRLVKDVIKNGTTEVLVRNLPQSIDSGSVRVDGRGSATICEVQFNEKWVSQDEATVEAKRKELQSKLDTLEAEKTKLEDQLANVNKQGNVLEGIAKQIAGETAGGADKKESSNNTVALLDSLDKVNTFLDSWSTRYDQTLVKRRELEQSIRKQQEEINATRRNLGNCSQGSMNREVAIILESEKGGDIELDVSYVVYNARWTPVYDLRVFSDNKENVMKINYDASISQQTGEDWTDAQLCLSTATPAIGGQVPEPKPLKVSFKPKPSIVQNQQQQQRVQQQQQQQTGRRLKIKTEMGHAQGGGGLFGAAAAPPPPPAAMIQSFAAVSFIVDKHPKMLHHSYNAMEQSQDMSYDDGEPRMMMMRSVQPEMAVMTVQMTQVTSLADENRPKSKSGALKSWLRKKKSSESSRSSDDAESQDRCFEDDEIQEMSCAYEQYTEMVVPTAKVNDNVITACFQIARATTIPSDNTTHKVNVAVFDLKPTFEHETVPAKSNFAYLKAKVTNTTAYPILAGEASVFLNNNFIAKSALKAVSANEEFTCSLGTDPAVRIEYKAAKKFHEDTGMINKYSQTTTEQHINVHNTRSDSINLKLLESIPTSTEEKIKVNLLKPDLRDSKHVTMRKENVLEYDIKLDAGAKEDIIIKWSLEHPKNDEIEVIETN